MAVDHNTPIKSHGRPVSDNLKLQVPYFDPLLDSTKDDVKLLYL